ncbi:MAG TPA: response regulator transcription factor [Bacilli bacterium]
MDTIKIMIVDDHDMVRLGLRSYLAIEPTIRIVAEADNGRNALDVLAALTKDDLPDIILLDLMMPEMDGVETTKRIVERYPGIRIMILTSFLEDDKVVKAIEAGAVSYALKTVTAEELIYAIKGACKGMPVMNTEVSQALARGLRKRSGSGDEEGLTSREKEVLLLIAEGKSNKEISAELHISVKTVKTHVSNLLLKCALQDRTQLAIYAHRKGWIGK